MDFITLTEYFRYAIQPVYQNKYMIILTSIFLTVLFELINLLGIAVNWLSVTLVVHSMFIIMYAAISMMDWLTGITASVIVEKNSFQSSKFFKKIFLIMFCLFMLYATVSLSTTFSKYQTFDNPITGAFINTVVFLFESIKIGLMIAFVVYEMTSLRENFIRLGLADFARILDMFLIPFRKIQSFVERKFSKVIEDEVGKEEEIEEKDEK